MKLPKVKTDIQVRFTDLDQLGHVSNSVYTQYLDMGRIDLYNAVQKLLKENNSDIVQPINVVVSLKIDYLSEIKIGQSVYLETWCEKIGNTSKQFGQHIYADGKCAAKATVIVVGLDPETRQKVSYPKEWQATE